MVRCFSATKSSMVGCLSMKSYTLWPRWRQASANGSTLYGGLCCSMLYVATVNLGCYKFYVTQRKIKFCGVATVDLRCCNSRFEMLQHVFLDVAIVDLRCCNMCFWMLQQLILNVATCFFMLQLSI